ncbi:hypothetical protein [Bacillus sp. CECT 9360]|uniref:hypothetical protein n=1 Tax=Bacillus sp. CECT 9360 TaxID=2845821 RepID=UPI001E38ECAA|nr:hypothetical protein [Bacillus sp. CECT 9360]CAH0347030.1 hypothetical protein BCI9360_03403 [Bacillus sp. CECT 9360]
MDENRKKIIIQEILYWKNSRLLPEQYCDFLLALYSEGEEVPQQYQTKSKRVIPYLIVAFIFLLTLFLNHFTQLPFGMQIGLSIFSIMALVYAAFFFSKRSWPYHIPLIGAAFLFLLATVFAIEQLAPDRIGVLYFFLLCHCGIWVYTGKRLSMVYFSVAGYLGIVVILYFIAKLYNIF